MARYDGDFRPANAKPLEIEELLALIDGNDPAAQPVRDDARACYLSSSDGWRDAVDQLGGAFAEDVVVAIEGQRE